MSKKTIHLYRGTVDDDGMVTVTSPITLCCSSILATGTGTVVAEDANCGGISPKSGARRES